MQIKIIVTYSNLAILEAECLRNLFQNELM
jgi:hypothetical protein